MNKRLLICFILLSILGCQNEPKEIIKCNINTQNGIGYYPEGVVFNGSCNIYYKDSIVFKTRTYKKGRLIKEVGYHLPGGELEYIGYRKNGHIHGDFESYYTNGTKSIEGRLNEGLYVGKWNYWDDDGSLNKTLIYNKEGKKIDSIFHK